MLIGSLELIQPLHHMLINHKQPVEHLHRCGEMILCPFVHVGHVYDDPVVFEGVHGCVGEDHRLACASQAAQEDALAGGSAVVETREVRHALVDLQRRTGRQFFVSLGEVTCAGRHLDLHNFLHSLISHLEDILHLIDALKYGVDQRIRYH